MTGRRLAIDADLDLIVDGHPVALRGSGSRLRVEVDDAQTAWRLFQSQRPGRHLVRAITDTLDAFGIDVEVVVGGRAVARAGSGIEGTRLGRAFGLPTVEVTAPLRDLAPRPPVWAIVGLAFLGGALLGARR